MEIKKLEELARLMTENDLCRLEVSEGDVTVKMEREHRSASAAGPAGDQPQKPSGPFSPAAADGSEQNGASQKEQGVYVTSPTVGVFYTSPSPESEPFVKVGDQVKKGDTLCIIEAMKLMNEIPAEVSGTIAEVCVSSGQLVEYNQPLFRIV